MDGIISTEQENDTTNLGVNRCIKKFKSIWFVEKFDAILLMKLDILDLILLQHSQFEIIC